MTRYYRREWDETRGDQHDDWGTSTWYFEVGDDGYPVRQVQVYANGRVLRYDAANSDDPFGGLGDQPLDHEDFADHEVPRETFEEAWVTG